MGGELGEGLLELAAGQDLQLSPIGGGRLADQCQQSPGRGLEVTDVPLLEDGLQERGVVSDAINVVVLEFPGERSAAVVLDRLNRGPEHYFDLHLTGERAALSASIGGRVEFAVGLQTRRLRPFARLSLVRGAEARLCIDGRSRRVATDPVNPLASATAANLRDFLQALERGREPECSLQRNRGSALLVFKAYESAESGRSVEL